MNEWRHKIMNNAIKGGIKIWTSKLKSWNITSSN